MVVCVGAMMVGSTVITAKGGSNVARGDELGYFKFGGSTLVVLFEPNTMRWDDDLIANSKEAIETLVGKTSLILNFLFQANCFPSRFGWECLLDIVQTSVKSAMNQFLSTLRLRTRRTLNGVWRAAWRLTGMNKPILQSRSDDI